jgi:hypothetical protein
MLNLKNMEGSSHANHSIAMFSMIYSSNWKLIVLHVLNDYFASLTIILWTVQSPVLQVAAIHSWYLKTLLSA